LPEQRRRGPEDQRRAPHTTPTQEEAASACGRRSRRAARPCRRGSQIDDPSRCAVASLAPSASRGLDRDPFRDPRKAAGTRATIPGSGGDAPTGSAPRPAWCLTSFERRRVRATATNGDHTGAARARPPAHREVSPWFRPEPSPGGPTPRRSTYRGLGEGSALRTTVTRVGAPRRSASASSCSTRYAGRAPRRRPRLCCHGFPESSAEWRARDAGARRRRLLRAVAPNQRGIFAQAREPIGVAPTRQAADRRTCSDYATSLGTRRST
jgi:hypothetical protein